MIEKISIPFFMSKKEELGAFFEQNKSNNESNIIVLCEDSNVYIPIKYIEIINIGSIAARLNIHKNGLITQWAESKVYYDNNIISIITGHEIFNIPFHLFEELYDSFKEKIIITKGEKPFEPIGIQS